MPTGDPMRPLVSVIMPAWEPRADWLLTAVNSVLDETDVDLELIVVDDGSAEPVARVLTAILDERLRMLRVPQGGPALARNAGLARARGDYVRFVDADDAVVLGGTAALARTAAGRRVIVHGGYVLCDQTLRGDETRRATEQGDAWLACMTGRFEVYHCALLFPRAVLDEIGGWHDGPTCEDWDLVLRALEATPVEPCDAVVFRYRVWPESRSGRERTAAKTAGESLVRAHFERHPEHRDTSVERRTEAYLVQRALHLYGDGSPWRSWQWWRAGVRNPTYLIDLWQATARRQVGRGRRVLRRRADPDHGATPPPIGGSAARGLDIPRLEESSSHVQRLPIRPGDLLSVGLTPLQAGVEDADPAVGELAGRLGVGLAPSA